MLVLSRKRDERIKIGNDITIVIVEVRGDKVRLGIDAPTDVKVHREEVFEAIRRKEGDRSEHFQTGHSLPLPPADPGSDRRGYTADGTSTGRFTHKGETGKG